MKVLLAKPGLDGHDVGVKVLAHALKAAGHQVVYTGLRKSIEEKINKVGDAELSFADLFGLIVDEEWLYRENRKMSARFRNAKFKERNACIENIKFRADRGFKKAQILELAQNRFISAHQCSAAIEQ